MIRLKKVLAVTLGAALMVGSLAGCGNNSSKSADGGFDAAQDISVVSREEGSGTRGAFVELTGVEEKDADGNKVDNTTTNARCFHRTHSSFIVLPSFSFLPARKYRHMARFIPILTLTGISLFYRFPYRFPGFILCRHRCVLSDAKVRCRA